MKKMLPAVLALAAIPLATTTLHAQQADPAEVNEWVAEAQQIQTEIQPLQQEALQDPQIQQQQQAATNALQQVMERNDPAIVQKMERMNEILDEARAAQAENDAEAVAQLTQEMQALQPEVTAAQQQAMADPGVSEQISIFQDNLRAKMAEIDPDAETKLQRLAELEARIQQATDGSAL